MHLSTKKKNADQSLPLIDFLLLFIDYHIWIASFISHKYSNIISRILATDNSILASPEIRRPGIIKPNSDIPKTTTVNTVQSRSEWEIRPDDLLNHGRMVGRGTYGTVYKAEVRLHGKTNNE